MDNSTSTYLKQCRNEKNLSQKEVYLLTGITDSRISKIENTGNIKILSPKELKKLAQAYDVPIVDMLINLGYLNNTDLNNFQLFFKGASLLDEEERQHVQNEIDFINRKRGAI